MIGTLPISQKRNHSCFLKAKHSSDSGMDELMSQSVMNPGWRLEHSSRVVHISEDAFATDRSEVEPEESRGNLRCRRLFHAQHSQRVNFLPFIQPMDTIRSKIYALHSELSEALFKATRAEQTSSLSTEEAKQLEVKQRDLLKKIANKENDLDKVKKHSQQFLNQHY